MISYPRWQIQKISKQESWMCASIPKWKGCCPERGAASCLSDTLIDWYLLQACRPVLRKPNLGRKEFCSFFLWHLPFIQEDGKQPLWGFLHLPLLIGSWSLCERTCIGGTESWHPLQGQDQHLRYNDKINDHCISSEHLSTRPVTGMTHGLAAHHLYNGEVCH